MQDPPEVIPEFIKYREQGYKIVAGIKNESKENTLMYFIRRCYYKVIRKISEIEHIDQFDTFGLYDQSFIKVLRGLDDSLPYLRGIIAELGFQRMDISYKQEMRKKGKSNFNFFRLYDLAMLGITSYSKAVMRIATLLGFGVAVVSIMIAIVTFVIKLTNWGKIPCWYGGYFNWSIFFGSVQLFFIGLLGEYIMNINTRVIHRPLVIEERRLNFDSTEKNEIIENSDRS